MSFLSAFQFAKLIVPYHITANAFMPSIESRIATASKDSATNACLLKTDGLLFTMFASIALHLITPQIFYGCLVVVLPLANKPG